MHRLRPSYRSFALYHIRSPVFRTQLLSEFTDWLGTKKSKFGVIVNKPVVFVIVFLFVTAVGISLTNTLFGGNEALRGVGSCGTGLSVVIGFICGILVVMRKEKMD